METNVLQVAAIRIGTYALGPGFRAGIWVQGCPFHCKGCISPDWILPGGEEMKVDGLVSLILANKNIDGITLSGGEPMQQAAALANLVEKVRQFRPEVNVICFTGYRLHQLRSNGKSGVRKLIDQIDLLIDGPYIQEKNDDIGLRGSSNQTFHYFTERLKGFHLENSPRKIELSISENQAFIVGVPSAKFSLAWEQALYRSIREEAV